MKPDAQELLDLMTCISEEAYAVTWMGGLEHDLWDAIHGGPRQYGRVHLEDGVVSRLEDLSRKAGGWIRFDDERGEVFVMLPEWLKRHAERRKAVG
jgi:hypothetical protein